MARIAGVNIPSAKRVVIALTYIHGIGNAKAQEIIEKADIEVTRRVADLTELEVSRLREIIDPRLARPPRVGNHAHNLRHDQDEDCQHADRHKEFENRESPQGRPRSFGSFHGCKAMVVNISTFP